MNELQQNPEITTNQNLEFQKARKKNLFFLILVFVVIIFAIGYTYFYFNPIALITSNYSVSQIKPLNEMETEKIGEASSNNIIFSPDHQQFAYTVKTKGANTNVLGDTPGEYYVVKNGKKGETYEAFIPTDPWFSNDSKNLIYYTKRDSISAQTLHINNQKIEAIVKKEGYNTLEYSPHTDYNGRNIVYLDDSPWLDLLIDGKKISTGAYYDDKLFFDPSGTKFAYSTENGAKIMSIDGKVLNNYELENGGNIFGFVFSKDGKHLAGVESLKNKQLLILDGLVLNDKYEGYNNITFSHNGSQMAYTATLNNQQYVLLNGKEIGSYSYSKDLVVSDLTFSPDDKNFAYIVKNPDKDEKFSIVINGKTLQKYSKISEPIFSPDNKNLAFINYNGAEPFVTLYNSETDKYSEFNDSNVSGTLCSGSSGICSIIKNLAFSPDGKKIIYNLTVGSGKFSLWAVTNKL